MWGVKCISNKGTYIIYYGKKSKRIYINSYIFVFKYE